MKISTKRDDLFAQLQTVTRAASTRSAVQALSGVHLQARSGAIELRATDMEIGLRVPLEGEVVRDGAVVLPARLLVDVVRALPGDEVTLELRPSEQDVEMMAGAATFHIRTLRLEDFPPFPEIEAEGRVQVPGPAFVETVLKVARSASRDETRPVLTGILVSASGEELRMVATDSYRLSVRRPASTRRWRAASRPTCRRARCRSSRGSSSTGPPISSRSRCARTRSSSRPPAWCCRRG
jgi:DNA polymerase-3 subunit beta